MLRLRAREMEAKVLTNVPWFDIYKILVSTDAFPQLGKGRVCVDTHHSVLKLGTLSFHVRPHCSRSSIPTPRSKHSAMP